MAEVQKNIEVPQVEETAAPVEAPKVEEAPAAETKAAEEVKPAETTEAPAAEEKPAEEAPKEEKPIESGHLSHKAQGLSFPKNLISAKELFWFGTDAIEPKTLAAYQKSEKNTTTAHSNVAWASQTGNGLLFIGDKKAPTGVINLSDATEPETDGTHKFHFSSKGNKHTFKAASTAERDNWVAQLKIKIAEAKELVATVTESETYKSTIESFKPAVPAKKEEKPAEEAPKAAEEAAAEDKPAEETPVVTEEAPKEEKKAESPKPLKSKRASFFGFINKKDEPKPAEETPAESSKAADDKPAEEVAAVAPVEAAKVEETPAAEDKPAEETKPVEETPAEADKPAEEKAVESPKDKASKRNSFFGNVFSKKEKKAVEPKAAESVEAPKEAEVAPTTETAPVIPPVESTTPLAVDVSSPATVPTETKTTEAPATNGESKKDTKEKRKSSLPFAFGKREKSPSPVEGEDKQSPFSKLRATIRGRTQPKAEDKPAEEAAKVDEEAPKAEETPKVDDDATKTEEVAKVEEPKAEEAKPATEETKPENVAATAPVVTAAA
jgi:hypothetical protein